MEDVVHRIQEYMDRNGHNATTLAKAIGMNRPTLVHILNGRNKPNLQLIQKLCAFDDDLDIRFILTGERSKSRSTAPKEVIPVQPIKAPEPTPTLSQAVKQKLLVLNPNGTWETYTKEA